MNTQYSPAIRAASYGAGAQTAISLLNAESIDQVADLVELSLNPDAYLNGMIIDQECFRQGVATGIAKVKELAASNKERGWLSGSESHDLSEVEEAIMAGYFGA